MQDIAETMESASHINIDPSQLKGMSPIMRDDMARLLSGQASKDLRLAIVRPASSGFALHEHVYWEIIVVGPHNVFTIDEIQIIPPGVRHGAWQNTSLRNAFSFNISLDNVCIASMPFHFKSPALQPLTCAILSHLATLLKLADAMGEAGEPLLDAHAPALIGELAALYVACFHASQELTAQKGENTPPFPIVLTEHHLTEQQYSVSKMAANLGVSTKYISILFRRECGMSAKRYLIVRRLQRACDFLAENKLAINEVARLTGWTNAHYFATIFRKFTGMTPSAYSRKTHELPTNYPPGLQIHSKSSLW